MSAGVLFGETFPPCLNVVLQWLGVSERAATLPADGFGQGCRAQK